LGCGNLPHLPTLPPTVTAKHRLVKYHAEAESEKEIDGYGGKDFEKRRIFTDVNVGVSRGALP